MKDFTEIIVNNKDYSTLNKDIYIMLHAIENFIPNDKVYLLENLESLYNKQECIAEELSYKQGLIDAKKSILY